MDTIFSLSWKKEKTKFQISLCVSHLRLLPWQLNVRKWLAARTRPYIQSVTFRHLVIEIRDYITLLLVSMLPHACYPMHEFFGLFILIFPTRHIRYHELYNNIWSKPDVLLDYLIDFDFLFSYFQWRMPALCSYRLRLPAPWFRHQRPALTVLVLIHQPVAMEMVMRLSPQPWQHGVPFVEIEPQANITGPLRAMDVKVSSVDPYAKITSTLAGF